MILKDIINYKMYFTDITWKHLGDAIKSFEVKDYMASAIWSSVFVESLLKDILIEISHVTISTEEISSLISKLRNMIKNGSSKITVNSDDLIVIEDIIRRSDEIRLKRNRLVHDTRIKNDNIASDAKDIYNNIGQIVTRYIKTEISKSISVRNQDGLSALENIEESSFPMFISTITPHSFEQMEFIEDFCYELNIRGIQPVRCTLSEFDKRKPMEKVRDTISACHGIIVIGLERSHVYYYKDREGSEKESESIHRHYSSSWLQLEVGMAIGMGKEVFVLCQKNIYGDGIFDRDWNSYTPIEIELPLKITDKKVKNFINEVEKFKNSFSNFPY